MVRVSLHDIGKRVATAALLALGILPLRAGICNGLPSPPVDAAHFLDQPSTAAYAVSVATGGPSFRITVRPLLREYVRAPVRAGVIEIARCGDGALVQTLGIQAWQPIHFAATLLAQDIDFDGYKDISVLSEYAAKYGSRSYWIYHPPSRTFIENDVTRELSENCLGREWHGGCWKANTIEFDPVKREINVRYLVGVGQCGSPVDRYRIRDHRLMVTHKEVRQLESGKCTMTIFDRIGETMRVTAVRRFNQKGRR